MKDKHLMLLKFFASQDDWVTSFSMSAFLNISVRSIKSYVQEINLEEVGLIDSSRAGFIINDKQRLSALLSNCRSSFVPQTPDDRKDFIFRKLLLEEKQLDFDTLANTLYISPATLTNELAKLKTELANFDLQFKTKQNQLSIVGLEENKRKLISSLIYEESKDSFLSIKLIQNYLPDYDLSLVKKIVSDALRKNHYFMDDFSLLSLVMDIAITMNLSRPNNVISDNNDLDWKSLVEPHIVNIVECIITQIKEVFRIVFLPNEIYHFALLVMTRAISDSINDVGMGKLSEFIGERVVQLVSHIQERTKAEYNISIINKDFTIRFSLHIKNLLIRLQHNIVLRNPQTLYIKNTYPFIYDVSVFIADIVTQETGYDLAEDEIAYFTLHLGVLIEERKAIKHEVRAVLVNPRYFQKDNFINDKLTTVFEDNLLLTEIVSDYGELETFSDYDLIITTVPYEPYLHTPVVQITPRFTYKDILAISKKIEKVLSERISTKVESKLKLMFKEELFFIDENLKNCADVINQLSDKLCEQEYVDEDFKDKLFERESVSSSAYNNIAMPHPLKMCANHSAIAVSIHPNSIKWNGSRVNIVFLLAINIRDSLFFRDIFDFITEVLSEDKKLKNILEAKTYDEFIAKLVSFAK